MKILLDTHLLIWAAAQSSRLPEAVRELLEAPENALLFSAASIWEISIKYQLNRPDFDLEPNRLRRGLLDNFYTELPITSAHAAAVAALPGIHKDPFDRMLVAQALCEGILLLTADAGGAICGAGTAYLKANTGEGTYSTQTSR
jgi:PIN domain nuclease of toxin-antitoxin system